MRPTITVVIPCFNSGDYIGECIESLIHQTFRDWEAIVVDDGSSDSKVVDVVRKLRDSRLRLIRHDRNKGLGAARNTGFRSASASVVLPVDADDKLTSRFLEKAYGILKANPDVDCVFTDLQLFGAETGVWQLGVCSAREMLRRQWIPGPGTLMRKSVWEKAGGYPEMTGVLCGNEDWDFWIAAVQHNIVVKHIPEPLYLYRRAATSMSVSTMPAFQYQTREIIYQRHKQFFKSNREGAFFRTNGYLVSSIELAKRGQQLQAWKLALKGLTISPIHRGLWGQTKRLAANALGIRNGDVSL